MLTATECPSCARPIAADDLVCALCGTLLRREPPVSASVPGDLDAVPPRENLSASPGSIGVGLIGAGSVDASRDLRSDARPSVDTGVRVSLGVLAGGAVLAPVFTLTPVLCYMGWFFGSLVHEMGHCIVAWAFGCPAYPAIRIDGHAAAFHQPQKIVFVLAAWGGLAWAAWALRWHRTACVALAIAVLVYPALAFTHGRELLHLLGGHLGELGFAVVFFWRALSGGFTPSLAERVTYATVAWYLLGRNVGLTLGLMTSAGARAEYAGNGSFGMVNDYLRAAEDVLGWSLPSVALLMTLVAAAALPLAIALWWRSRAAASR